MKRKLVFLIIIASILSLVTGCADDAHEQALLDALTPAELPARESIATPAPLPDIPPYDSDPLSPPDGAYTIAWISDPQHYSELQSPTFPAMTQFLYDEQDRLGLVYIVCTGDFVQTRADDAQWEYASAAMDTVDSIPCGVLAGNHDAGTSTQDYTRFSTWFGEKRYADKPWYGGSYEDNYCHFDLIDAGETSYIFVYIGYAPTDGAIKYAVDCFDLYPERIGVLCTHDYFKTDVTLSDNGQALYDRVVAQCENIYMVLCGHRYNQVCVPMPLDDDGDGAMDRMVYQLLMNYQAAGSEGGGGFLRFMQIDEAAGTLRALSYSPTADDYNYYDAPESQTEKYPASPLFEAYTIPLPWTVY